MVSVIKIPEFLLRTFFDIKIKLLFEVVTCVSHVYVHPIVISPINLKMEGYAYLLLLFHYCNGESLLVNFFYLLGVFIFFASLDYYFDW
jgi:hypothetical protein